MEVDNNNFGEVISIFRQSVTKADFLAIDTELTGLEQPANRSSFYTPLEERYKKLKISIDSFLLIQFGVCTFTWDTDLKSYIARPFNFYVFPQQFNGTDTFFISSASSLRFLATNKFDFNKLIYNGIPYLNLEQEAKIRNSNYLDPMAHHSNKEEISLKPEDTVFLSEMKEKIDTWLHTSTENPLQLDVPKPYLRRILFQELPKYYTNIDCETIQNRYFQITIMPPEKKEKREIEKRDKLLI